MTAREVLDGIKAQLAATTPGPWEFNGTDITNVPDYSSENPAPWKAVMDCEVICGSYCYGGSVAMNIGENDRAFIAAAPVTVARLTAALEAVLSMADAWEADYGPGSRAEQVLGKQKVSIDFAVGQIRTAIEKALTD